MSKTWTYGVCESCLKNAHEKVKMVKQMIISGNPNVISSKEMWVCPVCGSCRKL